MDKCGQKKQKGYFSLLKELKMALINLDYFRLSSNVKEDLLADTQYIKDKIIIEDPKIINNVSKIRNSIDKYYALHLITDQSKLQKDIELHKIEYSKKLIQLLTEPGSQFSEFVSFLNSQNISLSIFNGLEQNEKILVIKELLNKYCLKREQIYRKHGLLYSNITVQALYDTKASARQSSSGQNKIIRILENMFQFQLIDQIEDIIKFRKAVLFINSKNIKAIKGLLNINTFEYQDKNPDLYLKINRTNILLEAKHIKEEGGAQDKQLHELINFISLPNTNIKFVSFLDGIYSNLIFSHQQIVKNPKNKADKQRNEILTNLHNNPNNYFINTNGFIELIKNLIA